MSDHTVYLVTGSNRGIGLGLVAALVTRANVTVFAGARNPGAPSLTELAAKHPNLHPLQLTSGNEAENQAALEKIKTVAGQLDVIIANAGIANHFGPLVTTPLSQFNDHWETNTRGNVVLFQAAHKLLLASPSGAPRFIDIGSIAGFIGCYQHFAAAAYGSSKAASHFLIKVLHQEHPELISISIHPGLVPTDMGNNAAEILGLQQGEMDPMRESIEGILDRVDAAKTREMSGRFYTFKSNYGGDTWDSETDEIAW
ncbi:hypothetical protein FB45DRAFT_977893 [Roridomyces roridus]|uniref:NAD(P)-binding protein n=1 Tax=Roridomyces roridus TaxID=1738132 RepID=A0AAD7FS63_9AGAR|nr:hypothetical protein FB45DRAFT_977893 [Roridomyces roridus]